MSSTLRLYRAITFCIAFTVPVPGALAHGGGLDARGGHNDRRAGEYHCHRAPCSSAGAESHEAAPATSAGGYRRDDWGGWRDEDRDCFNTRAELLIARSETRTRVQGCRVRSGRWTGPYTGQVFTRASDVDIDHVVPLRHAHDTGGRGWSAARKAAFANDPDNLLIVDDGTNSAKGWQGPEQWMPPNPAFRCAYLARWQLIKARYDLDVSPAEQAFIAAQVCPLTGVAAAR